MFTLKILQRNACTAELLGKNIRLEVRMKNVIGDVWEKLDSCENCVGVFSTFTRALEKRNEFYAGAGSFSFERFFST